ncbi:MAG TPA: hypothetical protein DDX39_11745 [Bacteroidales bacterium]|nr:MAG: hypothetical protein A2W98_10120 [Bacteroidetes bacterium GWF2_33_38]OFY89566.1 MAG: hypothetical protein A2236_05280 [Bacteroidetes bacterium RIFOXYA2_FULL_33_7]HBF89304.1 hypothetical protein [Bacteroidales bacterium]
MDKVKLNVLGLSYSQTQSGAYALVLSEEDGERRIPIIIGGYEAQAIAIELEGLKPPRPLTHDLFLSLANAIGIRVVEVNIYKLEEGIFYSEITIMSENKDIRIDARTSDAIALALRFKCPIYTSSDILSKSGIVLDFGKEIKPKEKSEEEIVSKKSSGKVRFAQYNLAELNQMMEKAIAEENYELAKEIRDEISKRTEEV